MAGNRKHGFRRGNAAGRNGTNTAPNWFCAGCNKEHGGSASRTKMAGNDYCDRTYFALKEQQFAAERLARLQPSLF